MTPRDWACYQCGSRFATDADGELVEYALTTGRCQGCLRLLAILEGSAAVRGPVPPPDPAPPLTRTDILARLLSGPATAADWRKAAAGDRE